MRTLSRVESKNRQRLDTKVLAHPKRLAIAPSLGKEEKMTVTEIYKYLDLACRPSLQHLITLKTKGNFFF